MYSSHIAMDPTIYVIPRSPLGPGMHVVSKYLLSKQHVPGVIRGHRHVNFPDLFVSDHDEVKPGFAKCVDCNHCYPKAIVNCVDGVCVTCRCVKNNMEVTDKTLADIKIIIDQAEWVGTDDIYGKFLDRTHYAFMGEYHEDDAQNRGMFWAIDGFKDSCELYFITPQQSEKIALEGAENAVNWMFQGCEDPGVYVRSCRNGWIDDVAYITMANSLGNYVWSVDAKILVDIDETEIECSYCHDRVLVDNLVEHYTDHIFNAMPAIRNSPYRSLLNISVLPVRKSVKHRYVIDFYRKIPRP